MQAELEAEVRAHDAAVRELGLEVWIGAEPTFTDATSTEPWWLGEAEGGDKEARARALLVALARRLGGRPRLLRVHGRRYPREERPRFCLGALFTRDGALVGAAPDGAALDGAALDGPPAAAPEAAPEQGWLTVTPDPAVVEVNGAPAPDLAVFARWTEATYQAAAEAGLSPWRFRFNGDATDSGGGGQITFGGPAPERSPFFARPQLLPRLVRYLNRHPALSYAFAPDCAGSAGQGPRPDEGARERFEELPVALEWLARRGDRLTPAELGGALSPLLVDLAGNAHRSELNVEKLWNPRLPGRGQLGLVELRALRMPTRPEGMVAVAALFRAVCARLASAPYEEPLVDWGPRLHGQWGLPWHLRRDLELVLADLDAHGLGLGPGLRAELLTGPEPLVELRQGDALLVLTPARAFGPLVGDVASQESAGARSVDSSTARLQVLVQHGVGKGAGILSAGGWRVPLEPLPGGRGELGSVAWRAFVPRPGLHPGLPPVDPLTLGWSRGGASVRVALHGWAPGGSAYDGLPGDADEARRRRRARVVITPGAGGDEAGGTLPGGTGLDLRQPTAAPLLPP
jgi:uncharacterized protein (DUF2126 family)